MIKIASLREHVVTVNMRVPNKTCKPKTDSAEGRNRRAVIVGDFSTPLPAADIITRQKISKNIN